MISSIGRKALSCSRSSTAFAVSRRTAGPAVGAVRNLNVHEYQSMEIMQQHGIKTPECYVARTPDEAEHIFMNSLNKREFNYSAFLKLFFF